MNGLPPRDNGPSTLRVPSTWSALAHTVHIADQPTEMAWDSAKLLARLVLEGKPWL